MINMYLISFNKYNCIGIINDEVLTYSNVNNNIDITIVVVIDP